MKIFYIVAGANGSGKTTFAKEFAKENDLYFLNADELAKSYNSQIKAGKIFFEKLDELIKQDKSFVIETTLSGKYLIKYIKTAKRNGFLISLIYLFLETPEVNILRVKQRVLMGGHNVDKKDIIRRFYKSKEMFWKVYKDLVDEWVVYYNSDEYFEKIADNNIVYDEEKMEELRRGDER